jgi:hypothetical protein
MVSERESYPERGRKRGQWGARRPRLEEVEMVYGDNGINWEHLYEVLCEEEEILVLRYMGRWHKYDKNQRYAGKVDKYIEIFDDIARVGGKVKLVEIQDRSSPIPMVR